MDRHNWQTSSGIGTTWRYRTFELANIAKGAYRAVKPTGARTPWTEPGHYFRSEKQYRALDHDHQELTVTTVTTDTRVCCDGRDGCNGDAVTGKKQNQHPVRRQTAPSAPPYPRPPAKLATGSYASRRYMLALDRQPFRSGKFSVTGETGPQFQCTRYQERPGRFMTFQRGRSNGNE